MNTDTGVIRELTAEEPPRKGEISLTEQQALELQPTNREQRRAWAKTQRRKGKK